MWARSHLYKEVKSSKSVRVEKALGCIFFLARSPDSASKALEKRLCTQKFTCPLPSNILTYLVEEITSPSRSSHWNRLFFLHPWSDHPQSPPRAPHYSADFGPVEHKLWGLLVLLYFHSYWFFQLIMLYINASLTSMCISPANIWLHAYTLPWSEMFSWIGASFWNSPNFQSDSLSSLLQSPLSSKCSFHKAFCNQFPPQCHLHFPLYLNYCPLFCFCQI